MSSDSTTPRSGDQSACDQASSKKSSAGNDATIQRVSADGQQGARDNYLKALDYQRKFQPRTSLSIGFQPDEGQNGVTGFQIVFDKSQSQRVEMAPRPANPQPLEHKPFTPEGAQLASAERANEVATVSDGKNADVDRHGDSSLWRHSAEQLFLPDAHHSDKPKFSVGQSISHAFDNQGKDKSERLRSLVDEIKNSGDYVLGGSKTSNERFANSNEMIGRSVDRFISEAHDSSGRKTEATQLKPRPEFPSRRTETDDAYEKRPEKSTFCPQPEKGNSNLTGSLTSPDGKRVLKVESGKIFDEQGKLLADLLADGTVKFQRGFPPRKDEDINVLFRNYEFSGTEKGFPRRFAACNKMVDGKIFLPGADKKPVECIVRMGMVLDAHTGKQYGNFIDPPQFKDGAIRPGKIAFAGDPFRAIAMDDERLQGTVFDLSLKGTVFDDHGRLQGICRAGMSAHGNDSSIVDLQHIIREQKQVAELKEQQFQSHVLQNTARALFGDQSIFEERDHIESNFVRTRQEVVAILQSGRFDPVYLDKIHAEAQEMLAPHNTTAGAARDHLISQTEQAVAERNNGIIVPETLRGVRDTSSEQVERKTQHDLPPSRSRETDDVPSLTFQNALKVNGTLRIDEEIYNIKNGLLYKIPDGQSSQRPLSETDTVKPCGILGPGYLFQLSGSSVESLADQNRVLLKFHIDGEKHGSEYMLVGVGASYINKAGEHVPGGLISAKELARANTRAAFSAEDALTESQKRRNWFDNTIVSTITSVNEQAALGKLDHTKQRAVESNQIILNLFKNGFDNSKSHAPEFDEQNKQIRRVMNDCNLSAHTTANLVQRNEVTNTLMREGLITGAATVASMAATAATDGAAAPAVAANLSRSAQLWKMANSLGTATVAVGSLETVLRFKEERTLSETLSQSARTYLDGAAQALAMKLPTRDIRHLGDFTTPAAVATFAGQTALFHGGQLIRNPNVSSDQNSMDAASFVSATALAMVTHKMSVQMENFPVLANTIRSADHEIAQCAVRRMLGDESQALEKAANQAALRRNVSCYLLNMINTGTTAATYSAMLAIPEAIDIERSRLEKQLGKKDISLNELLQHVNVENVCGYVSERGAIAAGTAAIFAGRGKPALEEVKGPGVMKLRLPGSSDDSFFSRAKPDKTSEPRPFLPSSTTGDVVVIKDKGNVTSIKDQFGSPMRRFEYDRHSELTAIINGDGSVGAARRDGEWEFDHSYTDKDDPITHVEVQPEGNLIVDLKSGGYWTEQPTGVVERHYADGRYYVIDSAGKTTYFKDREDQLLPAKFEPANLENAYYLCTISTGRNEQESTRQITHLVDADMNSFSIQHDGNGKVSKITGTNQEVFELATVAEGGLTTYRHKQAGLPDEMVRDLAVEAGRIEYCIGAETIVRDLDGSIKRTFANGFSQIEHVDTDVEHQRFRKLVKGHFRREAATFSDLMSRFEETATRVHLDPQEVGRTYHELHELLTTANKSLPHDQLAHIAQEILINASFPWGVNQGTKYGTCTVADVSVRLYARYPSQAARVIKESILCGAVTTADGHVIDLKGVTRAGRVHSRHGTSLEVDWTRDADANISRQRYADSQPQELQRSHADMILQIAAVNSYWQRQQRDPNDHRCEFGDVRYEIDHGDSHSGEKLVFRDGEAVQRHGGPIYAPYLGPAQIEEIFQSLSNKKEHFVITSDVMNDTFSQTRDRIRSSQTFQTEDQFVKVVRQLAGSNVRSDLFCTNPLVLAVDTNSEPFYRAGRGAKAVGNHGSHVILIRGLENVRGTIFARIDNTWGTETPAHQGEQSKEELVKMHDLYLASLPHGCSKQLALLKEEAGVSPSKGFQYIRALHHQGKLMKRENCDKEFSENLLLFLKSLHTKYKHASNEELEYVDGNALELLTPKKQ